jgi:hypothetical protein
MPTTMIDGYKFRFYSSDANEPPHMHVIRGGSVAKIWLEPIEVAYNWGYHGAELNRILRLTRKHQQRLLGAWHDHFR